MAHIRQLSEILVLRKNIYIILLKYEISEEFRRLWRESLSSSVLANDLRDQCSIPGGVILKTQKMIVDVAFLNTQYYKVRIKGKVEQPREWSSALPYTSMT